MEEQVESKVQEEQPEPSREDLVLAALNKVKEASKPKEEPKADDKKEPVEVKDDAKEKTADKVEEKPVDAALEKTWKSVLEVDKASRELRKENRQLKESVDKYKDIEDKYNKAKDAIAVFERLNKDPIGFLAGLDIDFDKVKARKANKGEVTPEERIEQLERIEKERVEKENQLALENYSNEITKIIEQLPEHARKALTLDEILDFSVDIYERTHDIMNASEVVQAFLSAKEISIEPEAKKEPEQEAPRKETKKPAPSDEPKTLSADLKSASPADEVASTDDREVLLERSLRRLGLVK